MDDRKGSLTDKWDFVGTKQMEQQIKEKGLSALKLICYKKQNDWKNVPLKVAITGNTGTGKSSFINAILRLNADDDGAAKVDEVEATFHIRKYTHSSNPSLQLWDLPGVGSPSFPQATYLDKIIVDHYDFFVILSTGRFTENDKWLAKEIHARQKNFFFVRTKIDNSVRDDERAHPSTHNEAVLLYRIRQDCRERLSSAIGFYPDVFLISTYDQHQFDFRLLADKLIADFPAIKRKAMVLSLNILTEKIIREKANCLREHVTSVAALSAAGGAFPIHPVGSLIDAALIIKETKSYRKQFGLDDESLTVAARETNMSLDDIKKQFSSPLKFLSEENIDECLGEVTMPGVAVSIPKLLLPIIGSIIGATFSYKKTTAFLLEKIDQLEAGSLEINKFLTGQLGRP